jgi:hypothetical protein
MVQPLMPVEATGTRRTGIHRGGRRQIYVLDDVGRRLLIEQYDGKTETIDHLMRTHFTPRGIPRSRVKAWACQLGLARQKEPRWTNKDLAYIERHLHKKSLGVIAKHLKRTKIAVQLKAKQLGVSKTQEGYTMRGLMMGLGVTNHRRIELWIKQGWIRASRRQTENSACDYWYFSDAGIRDFIKNHPEEVDPRRADWLWLVDVLLGGDMGIGSLTSGYEQSEQTA